MKISATLIMLFVIGTSLHAQQAFTNNGNLQIFSGASVAGFDSFTNASTATLVNNGSLYIKKTLTNNQSLMSAGTGTLYLNGTLAQSVTGSQPFKTYNLVTDNTAGITLSNNVSISGVHTFTNGLIATAATPDFLIYEDGSSHTGSTDSRHVTGWVKKMGSTNFVFPVGDATYLRTSAIINLTAAAEVNCHYYRPTNNVFNLTAPLIWVNAREYWQMDAITTGNIQVVLNWDHSKVPFDNVMLSEVRVGCYTGSSWRSGGGTGTGSTTGTGSVTSFIAPAFSAPVTFGYGTDEVLPLTLISFNGERKTGINYLNWVTANEKGLSHFEIERSYDGVHFSKAGTAAVHNRAQQESYQFAEQLPLPGIIYYRIKIVDTEEKFTYTKIIALAENNRTSNSFQVLNPARNVITVFNKTGLDGLFNYRLINTAGQLIVTGSTIMGVNGTAQLPIPAAFAAGIYTLELRNDRIQFSQQILVEK